MSTDQLEEGQQKEVGLTVIAAAEENGVSKDIAGNSTPRSEVPIAVTVSTPSTVLTELAHQNAQGNGNDYFTSHPAQVEQQQQQQQEQLHHLRRETSNSEPAVRGIFATPAPPSTSSGTSEVTATGQVQSPVVSEQPVLPSDRPAVHSNPSSWSVQSAESVATLKAANFASVSANAAATAAPPATFPQSPRRAFPNQSYAALHNQQYPQPHIPPSQRQRSAGPGQIHTFTSAFASIHQQSGGSRTTANTPATTPSGGLFSVQHGLPAAAEWDAGVTSAGPGTYASPFLHFTHRVPPKETHVADVDVDPVSGRKLINHYEVIDELGRGTHGKVKLGRDLLTHDTYVAIKIVERFSKRRRLGKLSTTEDKVKKEVAILKKARHPNIVALLEVIDDPSRKKVYIVLEWVELGEIMWRAKAPKEIAKLEARRYEREKSGVNDERSIAEDIAVLSEVRKRLDKQRRRQLRTIRQMLRQAAVNGPEAWSNEMMGDDESDVSEDDLLSRISTATGDSWGSRLALDEMRRGSRASLATRAADDSAQMQDQDSFLAVTAEPRTASPTQMRNEPADFGGGNDGSDGLEGTMYGAYAANSSHEPSRVPSAVASLRSSISSHLLQTPAAVDNLRQIANDILEGELNDELEYVPVMTQQQCRVAFRDTMLGLQYLHSQGIVHRDIKPPNLLATKDHRVKISDFGVSYLGRPIRDDEPREDVSENDARDLDDEAKELAKTVGTPAFYAPELCIQDPSEEALPVTKAIDVWALGITLFCMLFARTPFVDNEWVMMRQIADEEIYIPTQRLVPVEPKPKARTAAHLKQQPGNVSAGRRDEFDIVYEEIGEDLRHLLHGLLTKDPRKRMTLEEVGKHPWTQADIVDKAAWLEEMDQFRQSEGKKIEISREDMNAAVVPLLDRVRSGIKKVSERLGFGGSKTVSGRARAHSNASQPAAAGSPAPSAASSSSNISQDGRQQGFRGEESIINALKAARDDQPKESPLSKSVAASPEAQRFTNPFDVDKDTPSRPHPPERANTIMATGGSMRTVRQSDYRRGRQDESPPPSPGLPGTPTIIDNSSTFGSILSGGMARRILASVREKSAARGASDHRGTSSERGSVSGSIDTHGEPSLAMSQAVATGQVNTPSAFDNSPPISHPSGSYNNHGASRSRPHSLIGSPSGDHLDPNTHETPESLSRTSSGGSITSVGKRHPANSHSARVTSQSPVAVPTSRPQSRMVPESSEEDWQRAEREYIRKRIAEDREARPSSAFDDRRCPPSPDDSRNNSRGPRRISQLDISASTSASAAVSAYSQETSPVGAGYLASAAVMSSSSDFGSTVSASISNPSIPSAASEPSSMDMAHNSSEPPSGGFRPMDYGSHHQHNDPIDEAKRNASSDDTLEPRAMAPSERTSAEAVEGGSASNYPADYHSDADDDALIGFDSESDSDCSTDSDGGIVMSRRRSAPRRSSAAKQAAAAAAATGGGGGGGGAATANDSAHATDTATTPEETSERLPRRVTPPSPRSSKGASSRSGSNNTMQKVRTRESQQEQEEADDDDEEDDGDGLVMKRSS